VVKTRQMMSDLGYSLETGPIAMYFLTKRMADKDVSEIQRMIPRRDFVDKWKRLEHRAQELAKKLTGKDARTVSGSWKVLSAAAGEDILFLSVTTRQQAIDQKLKNFFGKWRQVKEKLPFPEMAEMRITAQLPEYQKILDEAFLLLLDGKLRSPTEIVNFLKPYEPPPPPPPPAPKRGRGKAAAAAAETGRVATPPAAPAKRGRKPKAAQPMIGMQSPPAAAPTASVPAKLVQPAKPAAEIKKPAASAKTVPAKEAPTKTTGAKVAPAKVKPSGKAPAKKAAAAKAMKKSAKPVAKKTVPAKKALGPFSCFCIRG